MSRNLGPVCKLCRREGARLFLKGERCHTPKCSIQRRPYPPGMHRWRRGKRSEFSLQLREKQKVKRFYGILESQFRRMFAAAERSSEPTGQQLVRMCELRLDNVVTRLGFAASRAAARQLITHGHIRLNGKRMDIPSHVCSEGDIITARDKEVSRSFVKEGLEVTTFNDVPEWLERDESQPSGTIKSAPSKEEASLEVDTNYIIELLSK
ncbi:MAG: 30S ribosomal protein S4 [Planctomycetota bacterium]|nr:30S ribosomal protein S4 [Planctomycetota bacterium]